MPKLSLHTDFGINTSRKAEVLQAIDSLWRRVGNINQTLVNTHFKRFTTALVDVR